MKVRLSRLSTRRRAPSEEPTKKLVVVGDGACGKTSLLMVFSEGTFPEGYAPTIFQNYSASVRVDGEETRLSLWDTAGQEEYDRLRPLSYKGTDVILLCYGIDSPHSLRNVEEKWATELRHYCPGVPFVLVGNKSDVRNDPEVLNALKRTHQTPTKREDGERVATRIGAFAFIENSAKLHHNVHQVFELAARASLEAKHHPKHRCTIL
ncbi:Ras-like GTP-binding protein Rho1 [Aphelenchoides fujianensis]|nr:Ras-like GTP-binding protein Rho1 [Aphelenchoides fujianensis]